MSAAARTPLRRATARIALAAGLAYALMCGPAWAAPGVGTVTTFTRGLGGDPSDLVAGPDGSMWFVDVPVDGPFGSDGGTYALGRISPEGRITEYSDGVERGVSDLIAGPDGNMWFTQDGLSGLAAGAIGRITPTGRVTTFDAGPAGRVFGGGSYNGQLGQRNLVRGADGNLWFLAVGDQTLTITIGRITPAGRITEFPTNLSEPPWPDIVAGPDGNVWFSAATGPTRSLVMARVTPAGQITAFPGVVGAPTWFIGGWRGDVWFTAVNDVFVPLDAMLERIDPSGRIRVLHATPPVFDAVPGRTGMPPLSPPLFRAVPGPDGSLWSNRGPSGIERISPDGRVTVFPAQHLVGEPAPGSDGNMWSVAWAKGLIHAVARITPQGHITYFPIPRDVGIRPNEPLVPGPDGNLWAKGSADFEPALIRITVSSPGAPQVGAARVAGSSAKVPIACPQGAKPCKLTLALAVRQRPGKRIVLARRALTLAAGRRTTVRLRLDATGRRLLSRRRTLEATLRVMRSGSRLVATQTLTFRAKSR